MLSHLRCWLCGREYQWQTPINTCECGRPLEAVYDIPKLTKETLRDREPTLWRYREVLPPCEPVSLGEGLTPLHHAPRLGERWYVKDEGLNPTASFKARGMSAAISMARWHGIRQVAVPTAGNAGGAMAAYAAKAGMQAHVFMPRDTPAAFRLECEQLGARVGLVDGLITDCGVQVRALVEKSQANEPSHRIFDLSTLKESYRVEGKKTMGYELAEQMDWRLPDVIVYPTGGGTGLIGMWKAFEEMERLGWIGSERPRMISVQASGCAPIATAFARGERFAEEFPNASTAASGLRVPKAIGDFIMLDLIRASGGVAITVDDDEMLEACRAMAEATGVFPAPEGGATLAAASILRDRGQIRPCDRVVLFNTGSGLKYAGAFASAKT
ncbi:MAG TPA: threonine synthase [Fimbriimonadaceae bacterium]|nr:threonine synthase [Fimbriimonadaceae bacterium]